MNTTKYKIKTEIRNGNRIAVITPSQAERIFNERLPNRPFSLNVAKSYAEAMSKGKWKPCSQLGFCNGKLDDGQHRMMATVLSGVNFEGTIYNHNDPSTYEVYDAGRKRTNKDVLAVGGKKNATTLATTLRIIERVFSDTGLPDIHGGTTGVNIPTYEVLNTLDKYPGLEESANIIQSYKRYYKIPIASTVILHYLLNKKVTESGYKITERSPVDVFIIDKLFKGLELAENDPVYTFRKYIERVKARVSVVTGAQSITHKTMLYGGILTWNKWIKNKPCRVVRIPESPFLPKILLP